MMSLSMITVYRHLTSIVSNLLKRCKVHPNMYYMCNITLMYSIKQSANYVTYSYYPMPKTHYIVNVDTDA